MKRLQQPSAHPDRFARIVVPRRRATSRASIVSGWFQSGSPVMARPLPLRKKRGFSFAREENFYA
jgi:hypothetical protein